MRRTMRGIVCGLFGASLLLSGCASTGDDITETNDPFEPFNRSMFAFNKTLDDALLAPLAHGYEAVTPAPAQTAVYNVFDNLAYLGTALNQFLQGKIERGFEDTGRFVINSTFGLGGMIDFASGIGMARSSPGWGRRRHGIAPLTRSPSAPVGPTMRRCPSPMRTPT